MILRSLLFGSVIFAGLAIASCANEEGKGTASDNDTVSVATPGGASTLSADTSSQPNTITIPSGQAPGTAPAQGGKVAEGMNLPTEPPGTDAKYP